MPQFNVIKVNQKHLAKVNVVKNDINIAKENINNDELISSFDSWRNYISQQLKESKSLTCITIEHIFE
jgi:hypothetical protein